MTRTQLSEIAWKAHDILEDTLRTEARAIASPSTLNTGEVLLLLRTRPEWPGRLVYAIVKDIDKALTLKR